MLSGARLPAAVAFGAGGLSALLVACTSPDDNKEEVVPVDMPQREIDYRARFAATPIDLTGSVTDEQGRPLAEVEVSLGEARTSTDENGTFALREVRRQTALLRVEIDGYRPEVFAVHLHRPLKTKEVHLDPVRLAIHGEEHRLQFGGDSTFGRRFLSTASEIPRDRVPDPDPDALIATDDPTPGSIRVVEAMQPVFGLADYATVNLESVVTDDPQLSFDKPYVFFTLPGSVEALLSLGIDYVSLGNNHIYDYLEAGLADTLRHLEDKSLPHSGAGAAPDAAYVPHRVTLGGDRYTMISASSIDGAAYDQLFIATDEQGGAADAWDTERFVGAISDARAAGEIPIVHLHTGAEYTEQPIESSHGRMLDAIDAGAALIVAHHPHVAQGFEWYEGGLIAHSLGNFVFDQDRLETVFGEMLRVDLTHDAVERAVALPVYIEDFHPRPVAGDTADVFLRRIAAASQPYGTLVVPYLHQGVITTRDAATVTARSVDVQASIGPEGFGVVDLREFAESAESLAGLEVDATDLVVRLGRDILMFGDIEDVDADEDQIETARWWTSGGSSFPCLHETYRGAVALCSYRTAWSDSPSIIAFRNRVRVVGNALDQPEKDLSVVGYVNGENAGPATIEARYYASLGDAEFGSEVIFRRDGGSWDWEPFVADLSMPPDDPAQPESRTQNARALRLFVEHTAPPEGEGYFRLDEIAVVSWGKASDPASLASIPTPHPHDFIRLEGAPGSVDLRVTLEKWRP